MADNSVRSDTRNSQSDGTSRREGRVRDYDEVIDRFDDDIGPTPDEIEAWAERERRRRQSWVEGPTDRERLSWARHKRMRRLERDRVGEANWREPRTRSGREFQLAAQGAAAEFLAFPFRLFDLLVESGRQFERAPRRRPDLDDDLYYD